MKQPEKLVISHGAVSSGPCDLSHAMIKPPASEYYHALLRLMPEGMTEASWCREAKVSSSFFQDLKKGTRPRIDTLEKILSVVRMTPVQFSAMIGEANLPAVELNVAEAPDTLFRHRSNPQDVPILGTAEGAQYDPDLESGGKAVETTTMMPDEIVDYLRRPIGIAERKDVYALYVVGTSMEPRYLDGEPIFVDPRRTPAIGDHVVLQLMAADENGDSTVVRAMVKRLVRRTAEYYELLQYEPNLTFRVLKKQTAAIHRVIPPNELYGI